MSADLGIPASDAVLAACRRYAHKRSELAHEAGIHRVMRKSRIETRTRVAALTLSQGADVLQRLGDVVEELLDESLLCRVIQVSRGTVVIVDEDSVPRVLRQIRDSQLISVRKNLVEVAVTSPESIEETPGLLRHLAGVLAAQGINIVEALSCYTDTIFLLHEDDLTASMHALTKSLA